MTGDTQEQPIRTEAPGTEALLEHHFVKSNENAEKTHTLLEHNLVKIAEHGKRSEQSADHHLEMQGKIYDEIKKGNETKTAHEVRVVGLDPLTIQGEKGEKGDKPERGVDYLTPEEIAGIKEEIRPKKGLDYFTEKEADEFRRNATPIKGRDYTDGIDGEDGEDGEDGYTPKKGVDYFDGVDADPEKVAEIVLERMPKPVPIPPPKTPEEIAESLKGKIKFDDLKDAPQFPRLAGQGYFNTLADVDVAGIAVGQSMKWDGRRWIPFTPSSTGVTSVYGEDVAASGSGTSFHLLHAPVAGTVRLYRGGAYQKPVDAYTIDASGNITLLSGALDKADGEELVADYNY